MKKIGWAFACFLLAAAGCRKNTGGGSQTQGDTAAITGKGVPIGAPVTQTIDASGGRIVSPDGVAELVIPAGALDKPTAISIQPMTSLCPNGVLAAYDFSPEGLSFATPATLTFHCPDSAFAGTVPDSMGIAYQDTLGIWHAPAGTLIDSAARTAQISMPHFSNWTTFTRLRLAPSSAKVKVKNSLVLQVRHTRAFAKLNLDDELTDPLVQEGQNWSVNGVVGGDIGTTGSIVPSGSPRIATFHAPDEVPDPSTVAVSAEIPGGSGRKLLVSNITIYDVRYDITMDYDGIIGAPDEYGIHDEAKYTVIMKKGGGEVTNIQNQPAVLTKLGNVKNCSSTITNTPDGTINVVGPGTVSITPDSLVEVSFTGNSTSVVNFDLACKNSPVQHGHTSLPMINGGDLKFARASEGTQIQIIQLDPYDKITYTITPVNK